MRVNNCFFLRIQTFFYTYLNGSLDPWTLSMILILVNLGLNIIMIMIIWIILVIITFMIYHALKHSHVFDHSAVRIFQDLAYILWAKVSL